MHEIPFASDFTSPQQKILQDLQREHSEMVEKLELLKRLKVWGFFVVAVVIVGYYRNWKLYC